MFQLTIEEAIDISRSQNVTLNKQGKNIKYAPYVFTEQGVYMVATILKNDVATQQSVFIMRSFKKLRHYISENQQLLNNTDLLKLTTTVMQNKEDIQDMKNTMATTTDINKIMDKFMDDTSIKEITFLEGQRFEANEAYINIYKQENVAVTIFTSNKNNHNLHKTEVDNFCREYPSLCIKITKEFHDSSWITMVNMRQCIIVVIQVRILEKKLVPFIRC